MNEIVRGQKKRGNNSYFGFYRSFDFDLGQKSGAKLCFCVAKRNIQICALFHEK